MSAVVVPIVPAIELKRVLFTTDFTDASQRALPILAAIARRYGSKVFAAHVWTPGPYSMVPAEVIAVLDRQSERAAKTELEQLTQAHVLEGIEVEPLVCCGQPGQEIGRLADQRHISLAVMSTHGRTGFKHRVLGSVAEEVIRTLRCPVLTVGPRLAARFSELKTIANILFPTDFSVESMAVFPYLASLAHEYQSRLTILHVLSPETAGTRDAETVAENLRRKMKKALEKEISPRCRVDFVIDSGEPAETILAHARRIDADLIGLGVRGWTDIAKHFRETVAYRILAEAECPVLTHHAAY
jgi:nucleotide-binding universal stress UspA family protein